MPSDRPRRVALWSGLSFVVDCGCNSKTRLICAHVEDLYNQLGDIECCNRTGLRIYDRNILSSGKAVGIPFAQDYWINVVIQCIDSGSSPLYLIREMVSGLDGNGNEESRVGLEVKAMEDEPLIRFIRIIQDHYRSTEQHDAVVHSLTNKLAIPCFYAGHRRPESDLAFVRELKLFVTEYLVSHGAAYGATIQYFKDWNVTEMAPAFQQVALNQARSLINTGMCTVCWRSSVRPGRVDPDLIPDI